MNKRIVDTIKHTSIYSLGNISTKLIGLLLLPLYTAKLSVLNYGQFAILEVTGQLLVMLFGMNIYTAMLRWCSTEHDNEKIKDIVSTAFFSLLAITIILNIILIPFRGNISVLYFGTNEYSTYFLILFLSVTFEVLNGIPMNLLRLKERSFIYIILVSSRLLIVLILNFYFLMIRNVGIMGIFLSNLIGQIILFIALLPFLLRNIRLNFDFPVLNKMFKYSFPLVFTSISVLLLSVGDRFIIKLYLEYSDVGIYSLAYKIAGVINVFVIQSFSLGFIPIAFKMLNNPEATSFYRKVFKYYIITLTFVAFVIATLSKELLELITQNDAYVVAYSIIPILCLTFIFKGVQQIFSLGFHFVKRTKFNALIVFIGLLINFALNFLLIPKFGIWGAASTTLVSTLFISFVMLYYSEKLFPINYNIKLLLLIVLTGTILFILISYSNQLGLIYRLVIKTIIIALIPIAIFKSNFFEHSEKTALKRFLKIKADHSI